jgi:SAM-dependent methyltransferase
MEKLSDMNFNIKGTQVYQEKEAVNIYEDSHSFPEEKKEELSEFILNLISNSNLTSPRLLDAGVGDGTFVIIPLIKKCYKKCKKIEIIGFDNSEEMLKKLKCNLEKLKEELNDGEVNTDSLLNSNFLYVEAKFGSVSFKVYKVNLDNPDEFKRFQELKNNFDVCAAFSILHHLINWRIGLINLLKLLKDEGYFIFNEWKHDIAILDGNFEKLEELKNFYKSNSNKLKLYNFMEKFSKKRNEIILWNPEISASNYDVVKSALKYFSEENTSLSLEWEHEFDINKLINNQGYTYFWWGLTKEDIKELISNFNLPNKIDIKMGIEVFAFKIKDKINLTKYLLNENLEFNPLIQKVQSLLYIPKDIIDPNKQYKILKDFIGLVSTHSVFIPQTKCVFSTYWTLQEKLRGSWSKEMPLCLISISPFNENELCKILSIWLLYFGYTGKVGLKMTDFIFKMLPQKPIIVIKKSKNNQPNLKILKDKQNKIIELHISLSMNLINWGKYENEIKEMKNKIKNNIDEIKFHKLKGNVVIVNWAEINPFIEKYKSNWNVNSLVNRNNIQTFKNGITEELREIFNELKVSESYLDKFLDLLILLSLPLYNYLTHIVYISSEVFKDEKGNQGFGGIILGEDLSKISEEEVKCRWILARKVVNVIYSQFGIAEYSEKVRQEILQKGLRAAIASIMARNMSHNPISHALGYILKELKDNIDNRNSLNYLEQEQLYQFLEYLKARTDFIAEVTTYWREIPWLEQLTLL